MSAPTPEDMSEVRLKLAELEFRAKSDESFFTRLRNDPIAILEAEGLAAPLAEEISYELEGRFAGAPGKPGSDDCVVCDPWTCRITICCWWTFVHPVETIE